LWVLCLAPLVPSRALGQAFTPWVLKAGQPDTRDLKKLAETLYRNAGAHSDREKAEAIWRYLLTDGRFVKPGIFYHIAGWAYEEPLGEVLDPVKLLNSYGFGLCYQDGPLLAALWEAGGLPARIWFLEGHTVAEVFFDGSYHLFDSDMMGYTTVGDGNPERSRIASVRDLEQDGGIILGKLSTPNRAIPERVPDPWYPADVRESAMGGYAELFTTRSDNWLFPFRRFPLFHSMDFILRPGEKLIRYYKPSEDGSYYLPFKQVDGKWEEFPRELSEWKIRTEDGPHSQKDARLWADGRIEYRPPLDRQSSFYGWGDPAFSANLKPAAKAGGDLTPASPGAPATAVFEMPSPWVVFDAEFEMRASLPSSAHRLTVETSTDGGRAWECAGTSTGPFSGTWKARPSVIQVGKHGAWTAVSGRYGYLVRVTLSGPASTAANVGGIRLASRIQHNPRTLPSLETGENPLVYSPGPSLRKWELPVEFSRIGDFALKAEGVREVVEESNRFLLPDRDGSGELVFEVGSGDGSPLVALQAGGRFLLLRGIAPEKTTAETRPTAVNLDAARAVGSIEWAPGPEGPWSPVWSYQPPTEWLDGVPETRLLDWPEVDQEVRFPGEGLPHVFVRYRLQNLALDDIRLAGISRPAQASGPVVVTHVWSEAGNKKSYQKRFSGSGDAAEYSVTIGAGKVENSALVMECPVSEK